MRLPRAAEAVVPRSKLTGYALSPTHSRGRHKARVFAATLAITADDWAYLRGQIRVAVIDAPIRGRRVTPFGLAYEVPISVRGLNGRIARVITTWVVQGEAPPRLTSTWADIP